MSERNWLDVAAEDDFPPGRPTLVKLDDAGKKLRLVGIRLGEELHVLDDRCPHQGYPLSQGSLRDCTLTCEWHNWKFDVRSGECVSGGDAVRRYHTKIEGGRVFVDPSVDLEQEARRYEAGLRSALVDADVGRAVREALRLGTARKANDLDGLGAGFATLVEDGASRAEWGFDHALAFTADLVSWIERGWVDAAEAFAVSAFATGLVSRNRAARELAETTNDVSPFEAIDRIGTALSAERREEAEIRARLWFRMEGADRVVDDGLVPYVVSHLFDYGHSAIYATKALELCKRFPSVGEAVVGALTYSLSWATAETALPPFAATRKALEALPTPPTSLASIAAAAIDDGFETAVLASEKEALAATLHHLEAGVDPSAILRRLGRAAAVRLSRFDWSWESRPGAEVTVLGVTHALTFTEAASVLAARSSRATAAALAIQAAGFIGKLRRADRAEATPAQSVRAGDEATLVAAVRSRDDDGAVQIARGLSRQARLAVYPLLAPVAAFELATLPIQVAHTIKTLEAAYRLEQADDVCGSVYLVGLVSYIAHPRREFSPSRIASVAKQFLADGRPPKSLY